jgi:hypothetical protein
MSNDIVSPPGIFRRIAVAAAGIITLVGTGVAFTILAPSNNNTLTNQIKTADGRSAWYVTSSGSTTQSGSLRVRGALSGSTLQIGGTTATLTNFLTNTATLDFANLAVASCELLTITVNGAADGDPVTLGVPNGSQVTNGFFSAYVSATNTVSVKFCAVISGDPTSGTFRVDVLKTTP